jgi:hypothetical protein
MTIPAATASPIRPDVRGPSLEQSPCRWTRCDLRCFMTGAGEKKFRVAALIATAMPLTDQVHPGAYIAWFRGRFLCRN